MKIKPDSYMFEMIRTELTDAVGDANVDVKFADKFGHSARSVRRRTSSSTPAAPKRSPR